MSDLAPIPDTGSLEIRADEIGFRSLPPSLAILLNERLYERTKAIAAVMSRANGMTPRHLIGQGEACFSVVTMAMDWRLSWHFVARHTYQTPGGSIGFDGALVQSILEASGKFIGAPSFEYRGDWRVLAGKFRMQQSSTGKSTFPVATWTDADAVGLGIIVRWQVKGENVPRVWPGDDEPFWLVQCQPRNSPLWATDPKTQIRYLGIRRFANMAAAGILGAASFDREEIIEAADLARDVTPDREPRREDWAPQSQMTVVHEAEVEPEPQETFAVAALDGEVFTFETAEHAVDALRTVLTGARRAGPKMFEAAVENNADVVKQLGAAAAALMAEFPPPALAPAPSPAPAPAAPPPPAPAATAPPPPAATVTEPPGPPPARESAPPPSQPPEPAEANPAPPPAAAPPVHDDRFPGDLPPGQRLGGTPPPPAGEGGERQSKFIPVPQSRGKPDYRTLIRGLLITKIRQQTDPNELAWLLGDNAQSIEAARSSLRPDDIRELDEAIEFAWQRLR